MMQEALTVTVPEAAARRGVSRGRIWQMVQNNQIPAVRKGPLWLISIADLDALPPAHSKGGRPSKMSCDGPGGSADSPTHPIPPVLPSNARTVSHYT